MTTLEQSQGLRAEAAESQQAEKRIIKQARQELGRLSFRLRKIRVATLAALAVTVTCVLIAAVSSLVVSPADNVELAALGEVVPNLEETIEPEARETASATGLPSMAMDVESMFDSVLGSTVVKVFAVFMMVTGVGLAVVSGNPAPAFGAALCAVMLYTMPMVLDTLMKAPEKGAENAEILDKPDAYPNPFINLWDQSIESGNWNQARQVLNLLFHPGNDSWLLAKAKLAHLNDQEPIPYLQAMNSDSMSISKALEIEYLMEAASVAPPEDSAIGDIRMARHVVWTYIWPLSALSAATLGFLSLVAWPLKRNESLAREALSRYPVPRDGEPSETVEDWDTSNAKDMRGFFEKGMSDAINQDQSKLEGAQRQAMSYLNETAWPERKIPSNRRG